ncbi:uncharacterized protein LOC135824727 [Sycon ciliatum]|uniref:uncharacterized protein LOC135824727 n=1 Tax=Sycon ciliatum TaxID=27933 RepID=UPI0031F639B6
MSTLEDLLTDGAPSELLDPITEVLLRDPVQIEDEVFSRSTLVDLGWKHPTTRDTLSPGDISSADQAAAKVERYIADRLREKIKPLLLDIDNERQQESDVDTLLELLKAFERRANLQCVRDACSALAGRLDTLRPYEFDTVAELACNSLLAENALDTLLTFCRQHCHSNNILMTLDMRARHHTGVSGGDAGISMSVDQLEDFSPQPSSGGGSSYTYSGGGGGRGYDVNTYSGGSGGGAPSTTGYGGTAGSHGYGKSSLKQVQAGQQQQRRQPASSAAFPSSSNSPIRPLMSSTGNGRHSAHNAVPQQQHQPQKQQAVLEVHELQLKGMPLDIDPQQVTRRVHKYSRDLSSFTVSRSADGMSCVSLKFTSYDSACEAMRLLLGVTFSGVRPDMTLETRKSSSPPLSRPPPTAAASSSNATATTVPPRVHSAPAAKAPTLTSAHTSRRQDVNIGRWMYSVWMGNLPRPVSPLYQKDVVALLASHHNSVLGVHVHATPKGKYLFIDLDSERAARQVAGELRGRMAGRREIASKFSKKRLVYRAGSAHRAPLNLVTLYVTNIATVQLASGFLADQCPAAHAIDIPMPFKRMAFFQFVSRADAQHALRSIRTLQAQSDDGCGGADELCNLDLVVNDDTQDLIASDRLTDIYEMVRDWDDIQATGVYPRPKPSPVQRSTATNHQAQQQYQQQNPVHRLQQQQQQNMTSGMDDFDDDDWAQEVDTGALPPRQELLRTHDADILTSGSRGSSNVPVHPVNGLAGGDEEVYQSDDDDFLDLPGVDYSSAGTAELAADIGAMMVDDVDPYAMPDFAGTLHQQVAAMSTAPLSSHPTSGGLSDVHSPVSLATRASNSGKSNVCVEGQAQQREPKFTAIFSTKFQNFKCFASLSQIQLGYLTKFFHHQRSRALGNAFNRLQARHGSVMQFDKTTNKYFFHSRDEQAVVAAARDMSTLSQLHESSIHMLAHQCLLEHLENDVVPRVCKQYQVYAHVRSAKHSGCKTCEACAAQPDLAYSQQHPALKWDKHQFHIVVAVCGDQERVAAVEKQFLSYTPLNVSFSLSPTRMEQLRQAASHRHGSLAKLFQHLEDKYEVVVFHHATTFLAISGLLRANVLRCTTDVQDLAARG